MVEMESKTADLFRVLGVASRIRIIELLKLNGPMGVNQLSDELGISPSAVSQHLKILRYAGLVQSERKGYWLPYEVNADNLEQCKELLSKLCSCKCTAALHSPEVETECAADRLALLREYEQGLADELKEIRAQIDAMESTDQPDEMDRERDKAVDMPKEV
jgi:DNA-binding transcriptional ArsR family regulator